ncbi:Uncharacterised protein [[Clostridium] sordellii]|uniref:hypothetical protein n=1 Tax=Paraclostridium sordellii TaxID=1505 RepID=UPI0005DB567A|nr:hypothetical protein [Paeniclostridium sordellii]MDU7966976.1 hypothetical protein [Paeniclostridium sordellii]CEQ24363.1 Uncharacterised protein [[Clostridium] sordellii] [Paeniclostridium sordellii]
MIIEQLDLETRSKIYAHTKKTLRKYQKGITTGKLTSINFAENILSNDDMLDLIDETTLKDADFKDSYIKYIDKLIKNQNENLKKTNRKNFIHNNSKPTISQRIELKNLLLETGYELAIPIQYLNSSDVIEISKFISTGTIDLGNEKIYNYVVKLNKH